MMPTPKPTNAIRMPRCKRISLNCWSVIAQSPHLVRVTLVQGGLCCSAAASLFPVHAEFLFRLPERRLAAVAHAFDRGMHVFGDGPEPAQRRQRAGVFVDTPNLAAVVEHGPVDLVAVGRRGKPGRAQGE